MANTVDELFSLNNRQEKRGLPSSTVKKDNITYYDIYFNSAMCMHHGTGNNKDGYKVKISNIIEIENPGIIKIYKFTGTHGNEYDATKHKEVATFDLSDAATAKDFWVNKMGLSAATFDHTKMKTDISAWAHMIYQSTTQGTYNSSNSSGINDIENNIYYWWRVMSDQCSIRDYIDATGKMDSVYDGALSQTNTIETEYGDIAKEAVKNLLEPVSLTKDTTSPSVEYVNGNAYIGPLKATFSGGTPSITVEGKSANWATKNANGSFNSTQTGSLVSGQTFYAVIAEDTVKNQEYADVKVTLNSTKYKAKVLLSTNKSSGGQSIMFHAGKSETSSQEISWSVEQTKKLTIQKQDASGNALKVSGITFKVYDSSNTEVGTLTTGTDGKSTTTLALRRGQTYTLKETSNSQYGYKNANISSATLTKGAGTISVSGGDATFSLTSDATIYIKNTKELGNLTIHKVGKNNTNLEGVEIILYRQNAYVKLDSVTTPVVTSDQGLDITQYNVSYVSSVDEATIFKTNSSGKIVINNLEIYSGKGTKYSYWVYEKSNDHYGYNNVTIGNIQVTGGEKKDATGYPRWAHFDISSSTTVKITNTQELGTLTIYKKTENDTGLAGVEFTVWQEVGTGLGYLKLDSIEGPIETGDGLDITEYDVTYVSTVEEATKFKTDSSGKIIITNLERYSAPDTQYAYWTCETDNQKYGYKCMVMNQSDVTVRNGDLLEVRTNTNEIKHTLAENTTVEIKNTQHLGHIQLTKFDKDNNTIPLENVEFKITIDENKYLQLLEDGIPVESVRGIIGINEDNIDDDDEYTVEYIEDSSQATKFITNSDGEIIVGNLEVYSAKGDKYTYKIHEVSNSNYGYTIYSSGIENIEINLDDEDMEMLTAVNEKALGGISITKVDKEYNNILLEEVEFVLSIDKEENTYIALYKGEELEKFAKGTTSININNVSNENEYRVEYVKLDKPFLEYTESERENLDITIFKTDENAEILINNLEVNNNLEDKKYTYRLTEIYNPHYGYEEIDGTQYFETTLNKGEISSTTLNKILGDVEEIANKQEKIQISGYVWLENPTGKANGYDGIYEVTDENAQDKDIKITDLYIMKDGELTLNEKPEKLNKPIEIKLRNKTTGEIVKEQPDEYDENGKYLFTEVDIGTLKESGEVGNSNDYVDTDKNLANYEVIFVYDGFYYTTIVQSLGEDNGSKVKEIVTERTDLNNKFGTVTEGGQIVSTDKKPNKVIYNTKAAKQSIVEGFEPQDITRIIASTTEANYNLADRLHYLKTNTTKEVEIIENVNMGIVLREQPKVSVANDIHSVLVNFEGYEYNYIYNARKNYSGVPYDEDQEVGVKFDQEKNTRYTRTLYTSDVQAVAEKNKEMTVSVTYKIQVANKSTTLTVMPKEIINYFDARYMIKSVGLGTVENNKIIRDKELEYTEPTIVQGHTEYKSVIISCEEEILSSQSKYIFITFEVDSTAILDLLTEKSTYHNVTEIMKYSTYYGEQTGKAVSANTQSEYFISDNTEKGNIYAGIDKTSQPGNMEINLVDHQSGDGTKVPDTSKFEDDTSSAPSLLLEVGEREIGVRRVSGSIWEDSVTNTTDNQNLGNGKLEEQEKPISNVKVELHIVNPDGTIGEIAKYSNEELAITKTDENGNYTFGYYKEENGAKVYAGVLPGKYVIKYTYNNESYILGDESKAINVNDYKSTIITSDVIKSVIENQNITYNEDDVNSAALTINTQTVQYKGEEYSNQRWYTIKEEHRYSDAVDNFALRDSLDKDEVKYSNYQNSFKAEYIMDAYTPLMDIGVEFTPKDTEEAVVIDENGFIQTKYFTTELTKVDFGIIERPNVDIVIEKDITELEIIAQNGTSIIPKGNPSDESTKMQYVKKLDGFISAEIEKTLLQGAKLNLEYTITVKNNSDVDYASKQYYYYGITENNEQPKEIIINKIADYLDGNMVIDQEKTSASGSTWQTKTADDLYNNENGQLISQEVYDELKNGDYTILVTDQITQVASGEEETIKLYTTKYLAVSDVIQERNTTEIIELTGARTIKESIPGNNPPDDTPPGPGPTPEPDTDSVEFVITPPTGTTVNYTLYIIATAVTLTILVLGIVIIKKRVIK